MANEFKHGSVGTELTQAEWEAVGTHVMDSQAEGDIIYASSATQLSRLARGSDGERLELASGIPAWVASGIPAQAAQSAIEAETNENTYLPPDLMQHVPGVGRVAHLDAQVNLDTTTTLTNLSGFAWTTGANENFGGIFSGRLGIDDDPDMKFTFTGPTGAGMRCQWFLYDTAGNLESAGTANTLGTGAAVTTSEGSTGTIHHLIVYVSCNAEDTAGTFQFQWAQNTSHSNPISMFLRTWMTVHKVPE